LPFFLFYLAETMLPDERLIEWALCTMIALLGQALNRCLDVGIFVTYRRLSGKTWINRVAIQLQEMKILGV
jgi:hypothetical protein